MLFRSFLSNNAFSVRCFSSVAPRLLKIGDVLKQRRVYSIDDLRDYSRVSHDLNPLHLDEQSAKTAGFEDRLVHGMLVGALFPTIISTHFPGAIYVSQSLYFKSPVFIGDEIFGEVQAANIRDYKKRYLVKFSTKCFKNGELLVLDGEATAILPSLSLEQVHTRGN